MDVDYSIDDIQQGLVPNEIKLQITPKMIVDYFHMASYGHLNPQANDFPTLKRSNTLFYWKKAISNYMLMGNSAWDDITLIHQELYEVCGNGSMHKVSLYVSHKLILFVLPLTHLASKILRR